MQQAICDVCQNVLQQGQDNSAYVYIEWKMNNQTMRASNKQDDYCSSCTSKIQSAIEKLKIEEKNKKSTSPEETT